MQTPRPGPLQPRSGVRTQPWLPNQARKDATGSWSGWLISSEGDKMEEFRVGFLLQGNCSIKITQYIKKKKNLPGFERTFGVITTGKKKKNPICFSLQIWLCFVIFLSPESEDFTGRVITRRKKENSGLWSQMIMGPIPLDH